MLITGDDSLNEMEAVKRFLHWTFGIKGLGGATRIVRYIKAAPSRSLFLSNRSSCPNTQTSVSEFCVFLWSSLISWRDKKKNNVPYSSFEAEYHTIAPPVNSNGSPTFARNLLFPLLHLLFYSCVATAVQLVTLPQTQVFLSALNIFYFIWLFA